MHAVALDAVDRAHVRLAADEPRERVLGRLRLVERPPSCAISSRSRRAAGRPSSSSITRPVAAVTTVFTGVGIRCDDVTGSIGSALSSSTTTPASASTSPFAHTKLRRVEPCSVDAEPPTNRICGAAAAEPMQNASS